MPPRSARSSIRKRIALKEPGGGCDPGKGARRGATAPIGTVPIRHRIAGFTGYLGLLPSRSTVPRHAYAGHKGIPVSRCAARKFTDSRSACGCKGRRFQRRTFGNRSRSAATNDRARDAANPRMRSMGPAKGSLQTVVADSGQAAFGRESKIADIHPDPRWPKATIRGHSKRKEFSIRRFWTELANHLINAGIKFSE